MLPITVAACAPNVTLQTTPNEEQLALRCGGSRGLRLQCCDHQDPQNFHSGPASSISKSLPTPCNALVACDKLKDVKIDLASRRGSDMSNRIFLLHCLQEDRSEGVVERFPLHPFPRYRCPPSIRMHPGSSGRNFCVVLGRPPGRSQVSVEQSISGQPRQT